MKNLYPLNLAIASRAFGALLTLLVFVGQANAQCDQTIVPDTLTADYAGSPVEFCVEMDYLVAIRSDRFLDGISQTGFPVGCDFDSLIYFPYSTLPGRGAAGPYDLVLWSVDGDFLSGPFTDIDDLVAQMNVFDPSGIWVNEQVTRNIVGGENGRSYDVMTIEQQSSSIRRTINPNISRTANGTLVTVDGAGYHEFVVDDPTSGCRDTLVIFLRPTIEVDNIEVFTAYNTESEQVCLDNSDLLGAPQAATICDDPDSGTLTDQGGYCYTYTPVLGQTGSDVVCIEVCDDTPAPLGPLCKRTLITFVTESPTNIQRDVIRFQMTNSDTTVCVTPVLDLGGTPESFSICGPLPNGISITQDANIECVEISPESSFSGPAEVCVRHCIGSICDTTILEFTVLSGCDLAVFPEEAESIPGQGNPTAYCIPVGQAEFSTFTFTINGQPYSGPLTECELEQQVVYNYAPLFGNGSAGPYTLTQWIVRGVTFSTTFQDPTELVAFMRASDPAGDWELDAASFDITGGSDLSDYAPMDIVHNGTGSLSNLQPNPIDIGGGTSIELPGDGIYTLEVTNPSTSCSDAVIVTVGQAPTTTTQTLNINVFVDSVSETTCLFTTPRDAFSICGDVANGTTTFDGNDCVVYRPNPGFLGMDTLCVVSCDLPGGTVCDTTFAIFTVVPRTSGPNERDTIFLSNFGDAPFNLCNGLPITGPFSDVSICGVSGPFTAVLSQNGECVVADPTDGVAGTGEICVTFCSTSTPVVCQDLVFIITQTPSCVPSLFPQDTVTLGPSLGGVDYCLADGTDLSDYDVYVNGNLTTPMTDPNCGSGGGGGGGGQDLYLYPLLFINDGPLRIDAWDINGNTILNVVTTGFAQLADTMSSLDAGNDWTYDAAEQGLVATSNVGNYSQLILFDLTFGTTYTIALETLQQGGGGTGAGSVITIPQEGVYDIEVIALDGTCGDRLVVHRQGFASPDRDTTTFDVIADQQNGPLCLDVSELGAAPTSIQSCGDPASGTISYTNFECFNYQPIPGFVGTDTACVVICANGGLLCDTTVVVFNVADNSGCAEIWTETTSATTTEDCTASVNVCLPAFPDEFFNYTVSVDGVVQTGALACGADSLTIYSYADVAGQGQAGPYRIEGYNLTSGTYTDNLGDINALVDSLNQWDPNGNWALNPSNFTIFGGVSGFAYDTIDFRQIATDTLNRLVPVTTLIENQIGFNLTVGSYSISVTDNRTNCTDTLRYDVICTTGNECPDLTPAAGTELTLVDCDGQTGFEVLSPTTDPSELNVLVNGSLVTSTANAGSVVVFLSEGTYEVTVVDPIRSCASTFTVTVACGPCPGPISNNMIGAGVDCSTNEIEVCLPAAPDVLQAYTITIDGMPYIGALGDCNEIQTFVIDIFELPDGGAVGPYTVDSFRINGQLFTTDVTTMEALADTLNVWDATGAWRYDAAELLIIGGNPSSTYSDLFVTQIATSTQAQVALMQQAVAQGTIITIPAGATTRALTFDNGVDCVQEVTLTIACTTNSTATDTIAVTGSTTFCVDESELSGPIVSLENVCPDPVGAATFDFDGQLGCVTATGVTPGSVTACLVACDAAGVCDTTFYTVVVTPDGSGGLDAVDDVLRLRLDQVGMLSVTANDTFTGALTTITIVEQPARGMATLDNDGTLSYTPPAGECGFTDSLTYQICQGAICDRALVLLEVRCEPVEAFNGFSPNGDGVNDQLRFVGIEDFPNNTLRVYNRWGNEVLVAPNYQNDWDGTWDGKLLIDGTYFWQLEIDGEDEPLTGYLQIQR